MQTHEQQTTPEDEPTLAELEADAEREALEAEQRARAAEVARERLHEARHARMKQQLEPLRRRQHELTAAIAVIDEQTQAIIAGALAEGRGLYRAALDLYRERQATADRVLALGGAGTAERAPSFERVVMLALSTFRDKNSGWENIE